MKYEGLNKPTTNAQRFDEWFSETHGGTRPTWEIDDTNETTEDSFDDIEEI